VAPCAQALRAEVLPGGRKGILEPGPEVCGFCRRRRLGEDERQRLFGAEPVAPDGPEYMVVPLRQEPQEVPSLDGMHLHRSRSPEEEAPRARGELPGEGVELVRLGLRVPDLRAALVGLGKDTPPCPMGLVDDDAGPFDVEEALDHLGAMDDEPLGNEADPPGTLEEGILAGGRMLEPGLVDPTRAGPTRRGHVEEVPELDLPLLEQGLGKEAEDGLVGGEGGELRHHAELDGLSKPHLVG
jgi:hypothetical protein